MSTKARTDVERTRWLTPREQDAWIALSGVMIKLPSALDAQLQRDSGLTMFEYLVLSGLSMAENRTMQMGELAAYVSGSQSRLSNVIKRLEQRNAVRREPCPTNARFTHAILTDEGWDLVVAAAPGHVRAVRRLVFDGLTRDQVSGLREVAKHILDRADPNTPWP